jgi:hypothetical protein
MLQYPMAMPRYKETLDKLNGIKRDLINSHQLSGKLNYTRGTMQDENGKFIEDHEQTIFFFGTNEEFEQFRQENYPTSSFIAMKHS